MGVSTVEKFAHRTEEPFQPEDATAMGRICEQLRAVHIRVAIAAGVDYRTFSCPYAACATGSCHACEAETVELSRLVFDNLKAIVDGIVSR